MWVTRTVTGSDGTAGNGTIEALESQRVRHVPIDLNDLDLEAEVAHVGESCGGPRKDLADLLPSGLAHADKNGV